MSGKVAHSLESSQTRDIQQFSPSPPLFFELVCDLRDNSKSRRFSWLVGLINNTFGNWFGGLQPRLPSICERILSTRSHTRIKVQGRTNGYSLHLLSKFYFFSLASGEKYILEKEDRENEHGRDFGMSWGEKEKEFAYLSRSDHNFYSFFPGLFSLCRRKKHTFFGSSPKKAHDSEFLFHSHQSAICYFPMFWRRYSLTRLSTPFAMVELLFSVFTIFRMLKSKSL